MYKNILPLLLIISLYANAQQETSVGIIEARPMPHGVVVEKQPNLEYAFDNYYLLNDGLPGEVTFATNQTVVSPEVRYNLYEDVIEFKELGRFYHAFAKGIKQVKILNGYDTLTLVPKSEFKQYGLKGKASFVSLRSIGKSHSLIQSLACLVFIGTPSL